MLDSQMFLTLGFDVILGSEINFGTHKGACL